MTLTVKATVIALALILPATACMAKTVNIGGRHTPGEIANKCFKSGGSFFSKGGKGGFFGCSNDKKGTSVNCNTQGKCTGTVPN